MGPIRVTTALAALASSAPTPPSGGPIRDGRIRDTPSSSEDWQWLGNGLPTGESAVKPRVGLLPANPCQTGQVQGASSSREDCGVAQGWNG